MARKKHIDKRALSKDISSTSLGWELALPIFISVIIGYQIDQHTQSNYTYTLIGIMIGIIAGYYSVYKHIELEWLRNKTGKNKRQDRNAL